MGSLKEFDLKEYIDKYNLYQFIETGLGWGHGVQYAASFNFEHCFSIEISKDVVQKYTTQFEYNPKISLVLGNSIEGLKFLLENPIFKEKNICFWLDAHYPESDVLNVPFDSCQDEDIRLPLWEELNLIKNLRPNNKDVILMDDVMLFTENEIFPDNHLKIAFPIKPKKHINYLDKITSLFSETHDNKIVKKDSGYLSITPKNEKI